MSAKIAPPEPTKGLQLAPHQIVLRPLVTEKGIHRATRDNQYAFEVNPLSKKGTIKSAIEHLFNVSVTKVCTQNRKGKSRRYRFKYGVTKSWKKAIVTLGADDKIELY